jgi:alkaline phosphatase D
MPTLPPTRRQFLLQLLAAVAAAHNTGCNGDGDETGSEGSSGSGTDGTDGTASSGEVPTGSSGEQPTGEPLPELSGDPFTLGLAAGDPLPDAVILWTRLAPDPLAPAGGMPDAIYPVEWQVASDDGFTDIVASGTADADPALGHSVHADATGLAPDTWYFYRFVVGGYTSKAGRARTLPAADAQPERLRLAVACCHSYTDGYPTVYPHMVEEEHDLVIFLGDYIYEDAATGPVRSHETTECTTLEEYRARYALYKLQPELQAAQAACPWLYLWDDHEVDDNYAGELAKDLAPEFLARRAAAYQAFYEHMPLRLTPPTGADYKIYDTLHWGDLAQLWLLDTRQYREDQPCNDIPGPGCDGWDVYDGALLGDEQETWLKDGLRDSAAIWKILANQIVFSTVSFGGAFVNFDQWDGYPVARQRLLDFLSDEAIANVVILSGDLHVGGAGDIGSIADDEDSPVVAAEIVATSISSASIMDADTIGPLVSGLKRIRHFNAVSRGYVSCEVTREAWTIRCFVVDTVTEPTSAGTVEAELYIDVGVPGIRPV